MLCKGRVYHLTARMQFSRIALLALCRFIPMCTGMYPFECTNIASPDISSGDTLYVYAKYLLKETGILATRR